jgi:hypothetical protein
MVFSSPKSDHMWAGLLPLPGSGEAPSSLCQLLMAPGAPWPVATSFHRLPPSTLQLSTSGGL